MKLTPQTKRQIWLQNTLFAVLTFIIVGLIAWLSTQYKTQSDWTANNRNTLNTASQEILSQLKNPIDVTVFVSEDEMLRTNIRDLINRYQRYKKDLTLNFVNPDTNPAQARAMGITSDSEIIIHYDNREERLQTLSEQTFSNALQRLLRNEERWLVFLTGHGERDPYGGANFDLDQFTNHLISKGFKAQTINLSVTTLIPDNTDVLIIASPRVNFLPGETQHIQKYIEQGGNLLWLSEPNQQAGLEALANDLGIKQLPGVIVDANAQLFTGSPDFALVPEYTAHPITRDLNTVTLFPQATGFESNNNKTFTAKSFLSTLERSWTETGKIIDNIQFDENTTERAGPINIAFSLTRPLENADKDNQRIAVIGDGDFLANAYLGNGGNLELGLNIFNWVSGDDNMLNITPISAPDTQLEISSTGVILIASLFLLLIPFSLIGIGVNIWWRRRKR